MKVGEIWSSIVEKFKRSDGSLRSSIRYREAPPIPSHKAKTQTSYSIVVIGRSGASKQFDVSIASGKMAIGVVFIALAFSFVGIFSGVKYLFWGSSKVTHDAAIEGKLTALQEELRTKEVALAVHESRLKEQNRLGAESRTHGDVGQASGSSEARVGVQGSISASIGSVAPYEKSEVASDSSSLETDVRTDSKAFKGPLKSDAGSKNGRTAQDRVQGQKFAEDPSPIVNFNTQDVAIATESPGSGTLAFRLVKDHPNVLFSGYLFVFVEMEDKRGENKIYVYPDKARLSEGDLPSDFREGESISFKYNSRVELPFGDIRTGASLARVSILLYGDNGKIVFQRGFEKKELSVVSANANKTDTTRQKTALDKRRPL